MSALRIFRAARIAAFVALSAVLLVSCKVDKAALARQVDLQSPNLASVPDGAYEASYTIQPPSGVVAANTHVRVRVTVSGGSYQRIELLEPKGVESGKAYQALAAHLLASQKLSVDAISGATITSMAVLKAVQNAVQPTGK